ncbi:hypothetical protein [Priestia taiwanensis]|uniref:Chromosome-anchoring protein RacA n=1 Tax=Priestia taiwanensis TaxID=1347902 RepID=A0A917ELW8_9BACI|nr:hypothetical protein [Priestia taiwanensis]MBM7362128.1 chromosome-anchoring protein RacA [Priestia taiwanensis]GGE59685.1 chromosome-anchoring protein RacA [Priestia taiwanensis]
MVYKTNDVAEKLCVKSKIVHKYAKENSIQKNELGHYIFSDEDIIAIKNYISTTRKKTSTPSIPPELIQSLQHQLHSLTKRTDENERKLSHKADEGVNYQLLHHRKEIEELRSLVAEMGARLESLESQLTEQQESVRLQEMKKPKRRGIFMNILGL